jgi:hypothetical protein
MVAATSTEGDAPMSESPLEAIGKLGKEVFLAVSL